MNKFERKLVAGLKPLKKDKRDFSLGAIFGSIALAEIPNDTFGFIKPLEIKNQKLTDYCTAYASAAVSEAQENVPLDPFYIFFKTKQLEGNDLWGADLRDAAKTIVKFGSIEEKDSPFIVDDSRDKILSKEEWDNFLPNADDKAKIHKKANYFFIDGQGDIFDSIRAALWRFKDEKRAVLTGCLWRESWSRISTGIIPKIYEKDGFAHAFVFFDQKKIGTELYLVAQLSNGKEFGDNGIFYFPRDVVNAECVYGNIIFKDLPEGHDRDSAIQISQWYNANFFQKIWILMKKFAGYA